MSIEPWRCPRCGHTILPAGASARAALEHSGMCQGCRAALTFSRRPWLLPPFVRSWHAIGFPASPSWLGDARCPPDFFRPAAVALPATPPRPVDRRTPAPTPARATPLIRIQQEEDHGIDHA